MGKQEFVTGLSKDRTMALFTMRLYKCDGCGEPMMVYKVTDRRLSFPVALFGAQVHELGIVWYKVTIDGRDYCYKCIADGAVRVSCAFCDSVVSYADVYESVGNRYICHECADSLSAREYHRMHSRLVEEV